MSRDTRKNGTTSENSSPLSLKYLSLNCINETVYDLGELKFDQNFPWLMKHCNPFFAIPAGVFEHLQNLEEGSPNLMLPHPKQLSTILMERKFKVIKLGCSYIEEEIVLNMLKVIEATKSDLMQLGIDVYKMLYKSNLSLISRALTFFKGQLKKLPSKSHLDVFTICEDDVLDIIGGSCYNFISLAAKFADITNPDLKNLCSNKNQTNQSKNAHYDMPEFGTERIGDYVLESADVAACCLPQMRMAQCSCILLANVLLKMLQNTEDLTFFQLQEFDYETLSSVPLLPTAITKMCPFLTTLRLYRISNEDLTRFECIESLKELAIWGNEDSTNFNLGVVPFLRKMGRPLESLKLWYFQDEINFNIVDGYCPNLKRLNCYSVTELRGRTSSLGYMFKKLDNLYLHSGSCMGLQPIDCFNILSNCVYLSSLTLICCKDLNLDNLNEILKRNPMRHLTDFYISSQNLSVRGNKGMKLNDFL